jgi:hypothetical protein
MFDSRNDFTGFFSLQHWSLIVIVLMISVGLFLFVYKSTTFSLVGFLMALSAAFLSGARWSLSQLIMQKGKLGLQNPIDLIYHIQPLMVIILFPIAAGFEGADVTYQLMFVMSTSLAFQVSAFRPRNTHFASTSTM